MSYPAPPASTDPRTMYIVADSRVDFVNACAQLRRPQAQCHFVRTGDISALPAVSPTVFQEVAIWLYGWWTSQTPLDQLQEFGEALDALKNAGVLMDTW